METGTVLEAQRQRSLAGEIIREIKRLLESSETLEVNSLAGISRRKTGKDSSRWLSPESTPPGSLPSSRP